MFNLNEAVTPCPRSGHLARMVKRGRPTSSAKGKIPNRIREIREREGKTQEDLAEALHVAFTAIGKIERGETRLRIDHIIAIAGVLKCHPAELVPDILMLTPKQSLLLQAFERMAAEDQDRAIRLLDAMASPAAKFA